MGAGQSAQTLRIIGGKWRGRKVSFTSSADTNPELRVRPTPDRVRETLFNWLTPVIRGSTCLDLYSGSGILSMEALSRGAKHVTLIDISTININKISDTLAIFDADSSSFNCIARNVRDWCRQPGDNCYDIIFMDPPFSDNSVYELCRDINENGLVHKDSFVYLELPAPPDSDQLPNNWSLFRQKRAGAVFFNLCKIQ